MVQFYRHLISCKGVRVRTSVGSALHPSLRTGFCGLITKQDDNSPEHRKLPRVCTRWPSGRFGNRVPWDSAQTQSDIINNGKRQIALEEIMIED